MADVLIREEKDGILFLQLNRPEQRNAVNSELRRLLSQAMNDFAADTSLRVAVITGSGTKSFCAGADLKELAENRVGQPPRDYFADFGPDDFIEKPVITAVNGYALAGGFRLAQFGDLCIASENASFGISEAKWSRGAPWAAPLVNMIPRRIMAELLLTAQPISAQRAYDVGLVNEVVPEERLIPRAWELAETIANNAPLSLSASKWLMRVGAEAGVGATGKIAAEIFRHVYASEDALEGPRAFREGRKPQWKGR
ncbi:MULTISPECIES: enoyl-CoA hydratase/isomerase family protein [Rhodococcus]|uniref:enoyl-CoA hydratase/isomerase family protein n=1 Tax=Rhodococcus TaxID=1827 RepID=UPI000929D219|nr:enoyl-CoA hydratase-related protein [Rhodococcus sp. M8]OLL19258.1 enoyl-CoA hydratase [Rhodococcus sp. M8]OOL33485.1 enoyl-CoA hydratase [Rhodococcus rhodochrous]QPG43078.1 enoyl-CoA hydratase/isomerase family protein [Rhodococcus sp. M8]